MDDADFDSLRLGFNSSRKKPKTSLGGSNRGSSETSKYVGPWGADLTEISKPLSGPSEVLVFDFEGFI